MGHWTGPRRDFKYASGEPITSLSSVYETAVKFHNNTPFEIEVFWLDFKSQPIPYGRIQAMTSQEYLTYITHPWVFCVPNNPEASKFLVTGDRKQVAFPSRVHPDIHVNLAHCLPWDISRHIPCFSSHKQFISEVKSLLMAHALLKPLHGQPLYVDVSQELDMERTRSTLCELAWSYALLLVSPCTYLKDCFSIPTDLDSPPCFSACWSPRPSTGAASVKACSSGGATKATNSSPCDSPPGSEAFPGPAEPQGHPLSPHLGDLPLDLVLEVVRYLAPPLPDVQLSSKEDMELPPSELLPLHEVQVVQFVGDFAAVANNPAAQHAAGVVLAGGDNEMPPLVDEEDEIVPAQELVM